MADLEHFESERITEIHALVSEYSFVVHETKEVKVKIWRTNYPDSGRLFAFTQSHYFHGPSQGGPYMTSAPYGETEEEALSKAIFTFTSFFPPAGQHPDADTSAWFVANKDF